MSMSGVTVVLVFSSILATKVYAAGDLVLDFALAHRPLLRFDGDAKASHCWPDEAKDSNDNICRDFDKDAPIYYDLRDCEEKYRKLVWWFWYGKQPPCDGMSDAHGNDWEHITINFIKDSSDIWQQDSVTWYQHGGWYTRKNNETNPSVYVGKTAHGSYDNRCDGEGFIWEPDYCAGGCGYWDDFRNDEKGIHWIPQNMKHVSEVTGRVSHRIKNEKYFANTKLNSCTGVDWRCVGLIFSCGCWRNNHSFPAPQCDN